MSQLIHTSTAAAVEVLPFHKDAAAILGAGQRAGETMAKKMRALLVSRYGSPTVAPESESFGKPGAAGGPTFEQYTADQKALKLCCKTEGAQQWARKQFAKAVRECYGALPVAMTAEAIQKRAQREAFEAFSKAQQSSKTEGAAKPGAPAGETQDRQPTEAEQIESLVTRIGLIKTADAIVRILKADAKTAGHAVHLEKMLAKVAATLAQPA